MSGNVNEDQRRLIQDDPKVERVNCPLIRSHKRFFTFLLALSVVLIAHGVIIYMFVDYFSCPPSTCVAVKIMTLNTWGMPAAFGSKYKSERMEAIVNEVSKGKYDLYLFEELWMRPDYHVIRAKVPDGFHMTEYAALTNGKCDGVLGPDGCSGLAIISRYPLEQVWFHRYEYSGDPVKAFIDGEYLASKGAGRVRIQLPNSTSVDVFVTHTAADPDPSHGYNNSYYRVRQVKQLVDSFLEESDAGVVFLGGDFNAGPDRRPGTPYGMIRKKMKDCIVDLFYDLQKWLNPEYATYANAKNTFSFKIMPPITYDYIFYMNRAQGFFRVWTNWFELPFFKLRLGPSQKTEEISFSDHEAVTSTIYIRRR